MICYCCWQEIWVQSLGQEDPPGEGKGNQLQYSCLGNPMDRGAWEATVYGVTKNWTRLKTKQQQVNVGSHFMFARRWKWCTWPKNKTDFVWQTQKDHILTKWEAQCSSADRAPRGPPLSEMLFDSLLRFPMARNPKFTSWTSFSSSSSSPQSPCCSMVD